MVFQQIALIYNLAASEWTRVWNKMRTSALMPQVSLSSGESKVNILQ